MRFAAFMQDGRSGLAVAESAGAPFRAIPGDGDLAALIASGEAALTEAGRSAQAGPMIDLSTVTLLPPLSSPGKIVCVGLNYADHSKESGFAVPSYPTIFARFASSLIGHGAPMIRPRVSDQLDFEGELVAVIGRGGRHIAKADALAHVAGYSIFNDGSVRDYQTRAPQWTIGKNFDGTGAFGPIFVTADELPPGARGLRISTRLNGETVQDASTDDLIFDVATLVSLLSEAITWSPGDVIVTGTPSGVGAARNPKLWMKPGDRCEVEIEGIGVLANPIAQEAAVPAHAAAE